MRSLALLPTILLAAAPAAGQLWSQRAALFVEDVLAFTGPASNDEFAHALAAGDFDGDGADDLATGIPFDDNAGALAPNSGIVVVRYGVTGRGLAGGIAAQVLSQIFGGSPDPAEVGDQFGSALAAGDFDGDGFDDLAVGIPAEDDADEPDDVDSGAVQVYYGSAGGLDLATVQYFDEDSGGVPDSTADGDRFGYALAAGDLDGDGYDDLAIGVPYDRVGLLGFGCGSVDILYGSPAGLDAPRAQRFNQDSPIEMDGSCETSDVWGVALVATDFDQDGYADLAVGAKGENDYGGGVHFIFGSATGLGAARNNLWTQDDVGVLDTNEAGDHFGTSLAAGDFTGDGYPDLAIGVRFEDLELGGDDVLMNAGAFHLFFGGASGIDSTESLMFTQSSVVPGASEEDDRWSWALAAGDFDADGFADLAIGAPNEELVGALWVGQVTVLRGDANGLSLHGVQLWSQDSPGVPDTDEQGDEFARALAVGDFDGTGHDDLVIGAPRESLAGIAGGGHGAQWVLYGQLFGHGFEGGGTTGWSAVVP